MKLNNGVANPKILKEDVMKKMFLMLAIMALATGAFAAWTQGTATSASPDRVGETGAETATIYAQFTILGPEFTINDDTGFDTWTAVDVVPGEAEWQATPFDIENTGGVTLDLGLLVADDDALTLAVAGDYDAAWTTAPNNLRMWAVFGTNASTTPATADVAGGMATANGLTAANIDASSSAYAHPTAPYGSAGTAGLNLSASGANDDCNLFLGMQCDNAGWLETDPQTIEITLTGSISTAGDY